MLTRLLLASALSADPSLPPPKPVTKLPGESVREFALRKSRAPRFLKLEQPQFFVPTSAGLALGAASVYAYARASSYRRSLDVTPPQTLSQAVSLLNRGSTFQALSVAAALGSAGCLA